MYADDEEPEFGTENYPDEFEQFYPGCPAETRMAKFLARRKDESRKEEESLLKEQQNT